MNEQLQILINKFKNHDYYSHDNHRMTFNKRMPSNEPINEQIDLLNKRVGWLQQVVQSLITDGNRMNQCYEQLINHTLHQYETLKDQYEIRQLSHKQELQEDKKHIQELCKKIQILQQQITNKQEMLRDVSYRFQQLQEKASEVHIASSTEVQKIESQLIQESKHLQDELNHSRKLISDTQNYLAYLQEKYQVLLRQNASLKEQNDYYIRQNRHLHTQIENLKAKQSNSPTKNKILIMDRQDVDSFEQGYNTFKSELKDQDKKSAQSSENMAFDSIIQINGRRQVNFNEQKQLLNISEHYCKSMIRNRSFQRSKFLQNQFDDVNVSKSRIFKPQPQPIANPLPKMLQIPQKQQQTHHVTITQAKIQLEESANQIDDPYRIYFMLLTQSEKLNSPFFDKISTVNIDHLYQDFRTRRVPYNKWFELIKAQFEKKTSKLSKIVKIAKKQDIKKLKK